MPNVHNFDILTNFFGETRHMCIEKDCGFGGGVSKITDDIMAQHALTHFREPETVVNIQGMAYEVQGDVRIQDCRKCGKPFSQTRRRGRPKLECEICKPSKSANDGSLVSRLDSDFSVF